MSDLYEITLYKNNKFLSNNDTEVLKDIFIETNSYNWYKDYYIEGVNKNINKNIELFIIEYEDINNLKNLIRILLELKIKDLKIESIHDVDKTVIYCDNIYYNYRESINKNDIKNQIEKNKKKLINKTIYKILNININN